MQITRHSDIISKKSALRPNIKKTCALVSNKNVAIDIVANQSWNYTINANHNRFKLHKKTDLQDNYKTKTI